MQLLHHCWYGLLPALFLIEAAPVQACLPPPGPKTAQEAEENERSRFRGSDGLAEVEGLLPDRARVIRIFKGDLRAGEIINLDMRPRPCGPIRMIPGTRGLVYLTKDSYAGVLTVWRFSYLNRDQVALLKRSGLLSEYRP